MRHLLLLLFLALGLSACGKWIVGPNPANTPLNNYESLYETVKAHYTFFGEKRIDWDSLDRVYRPLIHPKLSDDSLYLILSRMLYVLGDGHVNLYTNTDRSRNADWYLDYDANFNRGFVHRYYWGKDYQQTGALVNTWLPDSIGYMYYGSFSSAISKGNLNYVLNRFGDARGLIIDVRDNGGGSLSNVYRLLERFVREKHTFLGTYTLKDGPGPDDLTELDSIFVDPLVDFFSPEEEDDKKSRRRKKKEEDEEETPAPEPSETDSLPRPSGVADTVAMYFHKPVVVLTNRHSYSATNFFAGFMSTLPNVTLIGDRTGGGGGLPVSYELPNGWKYRFSATRSFLPDGTNMELGIPADIEQGTGPRDELEGVDAIIERARAYLLEMTPPTEVPTVEEE
ncbi:MAG: S41 family peptidase [Lewinella sp.]|nr:S41 family peptidase [Lewinella sp.]